MNLIDLKTLGKELSLSVFTIRKFIKQGMPHYRVGNKFLVNSEEVDPWFAQQFRHEINIDNDDLGSIIDDVLANHDW
jgi:excisionase family DNA binding protein